MLCGGDTLFACFDSETGDWTATVEVDIDDKNLEFERSVAAYECYLYMGLYANGRYFVRFDVNDIAHGEPETVQNITPEILWEPPMILSRGKRKLFRN